MPGFEKMAEKVRIASFGTGKCAEYGWRARMKHPQALSPEQYLRHEELMLAMSTLMPASVPRSAG